MGAVMAAKLDDLGKLPHWPRPLSAEQAAAYCGLSDEAFRQHITVAPLKFGRRVLYDRAKIDTWVDGLAGNGGLDVDALIERLG
jgi:hypothetical protein